MVATKLRAIAWTQRRCFCGPQLVFGGGRGVPERDRTTHRAGLNPKVSSVASVFVSRWDAAVAGNVPEGLNNRLGIAIAGRIYKAYLGLLNSPLSQRTFNAGAQPQRLLWASTGTKAPKASDTLYIRALDTPFTVNTMPEGTLKAPSDHGQIGPIMAADGGDCEAVLEQFAQAGVDVDALATPLQDEGAKSFVKSWTELMDVIASKSGALKKAAQESITTIRMPVPTLLDLWLGDEQIHSQVLRKEFRHELSLDAVARAVERRGKRPEASFPGGDADDPSANAALAWKARVEKPVTRGLV